MINPKSHEGLEPDCGWSWNVRHIKPRASEILDDVSFLFDQPVWVLKSAVRSRDVAYPRFAAMYALRKVALMSLPQIGLLLNRDHTTIIYGCKRALEIAEEDTEFRMKLERVIGHG